jgi:hypothetical protein
MLDLVRRLVVVEDEVRVVDLRQGFEGNSTRKNVRHPVSERGISRLHENESCLIELTRRVTAGWSGDIGIRRSSAPSVLTLQTLFNLVLWIPRKTYSCPRIRA